MIFAPAEISSASKRSNYQHRALVPVPPIMGMAASPRRGAVVWYHLVAQSTLHGAQPVANLQGARTQLVMPPFWLETYNCAGMYASWPQSWIHWKPENQQPHPTHALPSS